MSVTDNTYTSWICSRILLCLMCCCGAALAEGVTGTCDQALVKPIPSRQSTAPNGSDFVRHVQGLAESDREVLIRAELLAGNMPEFLRRLIPITVTDLRPGGHRVRVTLCVLPDYLAIGGDDDFLLMPMRLETALAIATHYGFMLPTTKIVDAIYEQSAAHLIPQPLAASDEMRSIDYASRHNVFIGMQRLAQGLPPGLLTAGHKKDLVITSRLWLNPERVAIYGWHRVSKQPIQALSLVHGWRYADYSHGVRLVSTTAYVDGKTESLLDILEDPELAPLLSNEGPIRNVAQLEAMLAAPIQGAVASERLRAKPIAVSAVSSLVK